MARHKKAKRLNDESVKKVTDNFLKQNPEGFEDQLPEPDRIVITNHIPAYRKIIFINGRDAGYPLEFHYSSVTHPLKLYKLIHGSEYNLPEEIIEHLESRREMQYGYRKGADGHPECFVQGHKYLFQCRNPQRRVA